MHITQSNCPASVDIAIIGAGLAGTVMALALKEHSAQVALLDASPPVFSSGRHFDERSIGLADSSRVIFETLGIWPTISDSAQAIKTIHISEKGSFGVMRIRSKEENLEVLGWALPYTLLSNTLQNAVLNNHSINFLTSAKVASLACSNDGTLISIECGNKKQEMYARLVIIADGGTALQKMAGFSPTITEYGQTAIVANIETELAANAVAYERFTKHGPLALLPLGGRRYGVVWTHQNNCVDEVLQWDDRRFIVELETDFGQRLGSITKVGKRASFPLKLVSVDKIVNGCVILLGNAAHTLHPVAAQGFNLTLRDIALLAEILFQSSDVADADLRTWQFSRDKDITQVACFTDFLARAFTLPLLSPLRAASLLALDLCPSLRHLIVRRSLGLMPPVSRMLSGLPLQMPHEV